MAERRMLDEILQSFRRGDVDEGEASAKILELFYEGTENFLLDMEREKRAPIGLAEWRENRQMADALVAIPPTDLCSLLEHFLNQIRFLSAQAEEMRYRKYPLLQARYHKHIEEISEVFRFEKMSCSRQEMMLWQSKPSGRNQCLALSKRACRKGEIARTKWTSLMAG